MASGAKTAAFQIGGALGTAVVSSVVISQVGESSLPAVLTEGFRAGFARNAVFAVIVLLTSPCPDIDRMRGRRTMKVLRKAAATIGIGTAIVLAFAAPANAASASASSSYYKVSTLTCRSYVRVDDWTSGKIRVTATTACDKKALQINLKAIVMKSSKGPTMTSHYVHCPFTASCTSYAFVTNAAGRQTRCGVNSPMVNDSYLTRGAKVCLTA